MCQLHSLMRVNMACLAVFLFVFTGCGGGGGTAGPPVAITITAPTSTVGSGATLQCAVQVTGTSNTAYTATLTPNQGTFSTATGIFTAPVVEPSDVPVTITVTSVADTTKSASLTVSVKARAIVIGTTTQTIRSDGQSLIGLSFTGSGIMPGDLFCYNGPVSLQCSAFGNGTFAAFTFGFPFDDTGYRPRDLAPFVKSSTGLTKSNILHIAFTGDKNVLGLAPGSVLAYLDQGGGDTSGQNNNGFIDLMSAANGSALGISWRVGAPRQSVNVDTTTGYVVTDGGGDVRKQDGTVVVIAPSGFPNATVVDSGSLSGNECFLQPKNTPNPSASCFDLTQSNPAVTTVPVGVEPWSMDMSAACGETDLFILDRQGPAAGSPQVFSYSALGLTLKSSASLPDFTPADSVAQATAGIEGGWYVGAFQASCTVGVMGPVLANGSVSFKLRILSGPTLAPGALASLPATSYRLGVDEPNNRFLVAWFDPSAGSGGSGLTKIVAVDATTGTVTNTTMHSDLVIAGFRAGNGHIYGCGVGTSAALPFPIQCELLQ